LDVTIGFYIPLADVPSDPVKLDFVSRSADCRGQHKNGNQAATSRPFLCASEGTHRAGRCRVPFLWFVSLGKQRNEQERGIIRSVLLLTPSGPSQAMFNFYSCKIVLRGFHVPHPTGGLKSVPIGYPADWSTLGSRVPIPGVLPLTPKGATASGCSTSAPAKLSSPLRSR